MSKQKSAIDEEQMRRILGNEGPLLDRPRSAEAATAIAAASSDEPGAEGRRKRIALPDFEATFLVPVDIRNRSALYVSGETKRKILEVVRMIGPERMSATSYVENILRQHLELYKDEINRLYRERKVETLL